MREKLKKEIHNFLRNYEGFFHSESEVQILLANYLMGTRYYDNVFIEYNVSKGLIPNYPWANDKKISIDIVIQQKNNFIPIEVKYKTRKQTFPHKVFGSITNVTLSNQGAKNEGCYSFWKDIKRLEIIKETFKLHHSGILLFITNDHSYLNHPRPSVQYGPFSIHQKRQIKNGVDLNWDTTKKDINPIRAKKFPGFNISNDYKIFWNDLKIKEHKYILI